MGSTSRTAPAAGVTWSSRHGGNQRRSRPSPIGLHGVDLGAQLRPLFCTSLASRSRPWAVKRSLQGV